MSLKEVVIAFKIWQKKYVKQFQKDRRSGVGNFKLNSQIKWLQLTKCKTKLNKENGNAIHTWKDRFVEVPY